MREGPEESRTTIMQDPRGSHRRADVQDARVLLVRAQKTIEERAALIPDDEDLQTMLELERHSALIPKLSEWPLLDSSREFLAAEMAELEEKLAKLGTSRDDANFLC